MSEVQSRPAAPRGRGSTRGGRGGYGARGGPRGGSRSATNGDKAGHGSTVPNDEEEGEIGELKKQYSSKLSTIKEMFPDWTDEDVVFALRETDGNLEDTIERITEGSISQWGEVKKKSKDRSRSKVKEPSPALADSTNLPSRGGRGRGGLEGSRGGRGRGSERGRGGGRGGRGGATPTPNAGRSYSSYKDASDGLTDTFKSSATDEGSTWDTTPTKPETSSNNWDQPATNAEGVGNGTPWENPLAYETAPPTASEGQKSSLIPEGTKKSWASMFAAKPATVASAPKQAPAPAGQDVSGVPAQEHEADVQQRLEQESLHPPPIESEPGAVEEITPVGTPVAIPSEPALNVTPSKDELTETNLEQVLDTSVPPATATAASTVASSRVDTPATIGQQQSMSRPPMGGYATSAYKATGTPGRTSSFQRRVLDQQEAVVMPGNHAVDRAAVQFGSMGLNGSTEDLDVDEDREEAETRAQPPQHSPVAHPVASLPPAPRQPSLPTQQPVAEPLPTPRQAPGLPPPPQQHQPIPQQQHSPQPPVGPQIMSQQPSQGSHQYGQLGRYSQQPTHQEQATPSAKPYDPFGQQAVQPQSQPQSQSQSQSQSHQNQNQNQYDGYPAHSQAPAQHPQHAQSQNAMGGSTSTANDYSSYYTSDQQRNAYQNYYGSAYSQPGGQTQQDAGTSQQRSASGFGGGHTDSHAQYPTSQAPQSQSRYGEPHNSGHTTPNPSLTAQQPQQHHGTQAQQSQHMQQPQGPQGPQGQAGSYPYGHPYYASPYYAAYLNQFGYGNQSYGGGPYGGKGGMYGQPHQNYAMSPQPYEHSSSPANIGGFGQPSLHGRDSAHSGALGDYGRSGSAQPSQSQQHSAGGGAFGGMPDVFGRSASGYPGQSPLGQQHGGAQAGNEETLKPFGESKPTGGPSPSLNQPGRPGSATNAPSQPGPSGLPPPQSQQGQQGFGGYPSHLNHPVHGSQGAQYGGLGGLGGHQGGAQTHQTGGYGSYGSGFGGSNYYGNSGGGRGGWGGNYGH
ncbi:MAG: hypothetical protein M1812_004819 [Candelaria pacifica]|nr:MAG: hypothetical protein M1812_004819 [Candelaria pacifica]